MKDILQQLQSKIDKQSSDISLFEEDVNEGCVQFSGILKQLRKDQTLDKRLYAEIVSLRRECNA